MNRIKECRMSKGFSQKYVAVTLGVAQPSVFAWENGKTLPSNENLKALAKLFGVSTDYLLGVDHVEDAAVMPIAEIQQAIITDREQEIRRMEQYEQTMSLLSGLTPENKEKALAYIKYLEFTQG